MKQQQVILAVALLASSVMSQSALVEYNVWDNNDCSGDPISITRSNLTIGAARTCASNYANNTCAAVNDGSTQFQKVTCPTTFDDSFSLVSGQGLYLKLSSYAKTDCSGIQSGRQLYIADSKCRKLPFAAYMTVSCTPDKSAAFKMCYDAACTNCTTAAGQGFDGDINICLNSTYVGTRLRCAPANSASAIGLSSGLVVLILMFLASI
jgi:hypothetical protein